MNCYVDDCERKTVCKGLCDKHYRRMLKRGSPYDIGSKKVDPGDEIERFNKKYIKNEDTGCWIWIGGTRPNAKGTLYGRHHLDNGQAIGAHRFSYLKNIGKIPTGAYVCHKCDVPLCVNPDHLFTGSHRDNMKDMVNKGRSFKGFGENKKGRSKLTNDQADQIRKMDGTYKEIADLFSVSISVIGRIKRLESYFNVETLPE